MRKKPHHSSELKNNTPKERVSIPEKDSGHLLSVSYR